MRRRAVAVLSALLLVTSLTAASCDEPLDVSTAPVARATVSEVVDAPASVTARAAATLTAPTEGTLARLAVTPGQQVRKGQVLAVIDSPTAQARLRQAKATLDAAKRAGGGTPSISLGGSRRHLDQAADTAFTQARAAAAHVADAQLRAALLAQVSAAEKQYAAAARAASSAAHAVERGVSSLGSAMQALGAAQKLQAQQAYDLAKATVAALTLRAPLAGVVQLGGPSGGTTAPTDLSSLLSGFGGGLSGPAAGTGTPAGVASAAPVGAPVAAGAGIVTIVDVSELGLVAEVDETDILLVAPGIAADVELDAAPGVNYPATVRAVDVLPTPNSRGAVAYRVHLTLGPATRTDGTAAPTPRPGMSAVVRLRVRQAADVLAVPAAAVFTVDGHDTVWVRRDDGAAERRTVRIGVSGTDDLQVLDGLHEGDRIVVRGVDRVGAGDPLP